MSTNRTTATLRIGAAIAALAAGRLMAGIPTHEERVRDSGLNPSNCTWQAEKITVWSPATTGAPPAVGYRCDVVLTAPAREAVLSFLAKNTQPETELRLAVNGRPAHRAVVWSDGYWQHVDLGAALRAGTNALTLAASSRPEWFVLAAQGAVFCEDGSTVPLRTDSRTWRGGINPPPGWDLPETPLTNLPPVRGQGRMGWESDYPRANPRHSGCIRLAWPKGMKDPVFDAGTPVDIRVTLLNQRRADSPTNAAPRLAYAVMNEHTRATVAEGGMDLRPEGRWDYAGLWRHAGLPAGAYRIRFALTAGGATIDQRDAEIACVGRVPQREVEGISYEDGMELKEVWSVDCTAEPRPGEFLALYEIAKGETPLETRVVDGPAGRYREMVKPEIYSHFAYRFKVRNLFVPHLAVVEWPDDAPRQIVAQVVEGESMIPEGFGAYGQGYGFTRGEASVMCTEEYPRSNRMRKLQFIYWPNEENEALHIYNYHGQAPAAAARLAVYEITNDIPALRIRDAGERLTGYHTERGPYTMTMSYYAGPLGAAFPLLLSWGDQEEFYRNWYTTTENLVKRMRFAGQNLYVMGHFMYYDAPTHLSYPSPRLSPTLPQHDYIAFILREFELNGLNLSSCVEFTGLRELFAASPASIEEVRAGAPTLCTVSRDGEFWDMVGHPALNFFHPRVQEGILNVVGELADLYKGYPAWKGVTLIVNSTFCGPLARFVKDPFDMGYEDITVEQFRKDTGLKVPGAPGDPQRFRQRHDWITANAADRWVDWKCAQFTRMFRAYRDRLAQARPDLKLYLTMREPQAGRIQGYFKDKLGSAADMQRSLKLLGFDADALRKEPGIVTSFMFMSPGTKQGHEAARTPMWRDFARSQDWNDLFANDGKGGAYVFSGFTEGNRFIAKDKWIWRYSVVRQGYPWPPDEYANDVFVNVLCRANPTVLPHTWADVNDPGGHLQEQRLFARAYRSLPNGRYERLRGNGLDTNLWVERCRRDGAEYAYAANPQWWPLEEVTLTFAPRAKVHDLIADRPVALRDNAWTFRLGPFEIRTFRIGAPAGRDAIRGAATPVPAPARAAVGAATEDLRRQLARAKEREADLRDLPGWKSMDFLESALAEIGTLDRGGRMDEAQRLVSSSAFRQARDALEFDALQASPFLVIGPFGSTNWTDLSVYGGEVKSDCPGMATPWIGEYEGADAPALKPGFAPDLAAAYRTGDAGTATRWQPALKTQYLSFPAACRSEPPWWMTAYAWTEIYSPDDRGAVLWAGSDHALRVWVNDQLVIRHGGQGTHRGGQRPSRPDVDRSEIRLRQGWNRLLVKALQRGETHIHLRLTDARGESLDDLRYRVAAAK